MPRPASSHAAPRPGKPDVREAALAALAECCAAAAENRVLLMRLGADPACQDTLDALIINGARLAENRAEVARIGTDEVTLMEAVAAGVAIAEARQARLRGLTPAAAPETPARTRGLQVIPAPASM